MSHVERVEAAGSAWGLVAVIVAITLICAATLAVWPWLPRLHELHRAGMARVRKDSTPRRRTPATTGTTNREDASWQREQ